MAKGKKRRTRKSLNGIEAAIATTKVQGELSGAQLAIGLATLAGANLFGSTVLGKHVLLPALLAGGIGVYKKNLYWTMAGAGILLAGAMPKDKEETPAGGEEAGFNFKDFAEKVKERAKNYFSNYADKLYLPAHNDAEVNGLNGDEKVNYFVNPYSKAGELDMSALDKVQGDIAAAGQMQGTTQELEAGERNY